MIRKSILLAALVTLAPAALLAADPAATAPPAGRPHGEGRWFSQLDANHDGAISKDEATAAAQARVQKMFAKLDTNHDGLITQDEIRAAEQARRAEMKAKAAARFKAADKNGDGFLSKDEAAALPMLARHFDALDTNKDGMLSPEEIEAASHHHFAGRGWKGNGGGAPSQR
ncbi:MAG: EF-hand domain-containing protein [Gammaproteobacteria bacterium]